MKLKEFYKIGNSVLHNLYEENEINSILKRLVGYVLQIEESQLLSKEDLKLKLEVEQQLNQALNILSQGVPIQYVLGETSFYGFDLYVQTGVLIPRQETEELVDWILKQDKDALDVLDIGVGSGAITLALGMNMPKANFTAIDNAFEALDIARENCDKYRLSPTFLYGDVLQWENLDLDCYDVIVSNPPYVRNQEKAQMHKNVLNYEPHKALFVPDDNPLLFYKEIANLGIKHLKKGGHLYFEINESMGEDMVVLLESKGYVSIELRKDINGKDRMIRAEKI